MAKRLSKLTTVQITQDFIAAHWNWTDAEKAQLGDVEEMGKIIKSRLDNAGCEVDEMYAIKHDKDEHKMWDECKLEYVLTFTTNHAHFVVKFKKREKTLPEIANAVGVAENYIEKPKAGRYGYDNMLSYLIHIKYDKKYQYPVANVCTICGKPYIEYYRESYERWTIGRAEVSVKSAREIVNFLKNGIADGEITLDDILANQEWRKAYTLHPVSIDRTLNTLEKLNEREKKIEMEQERLRMHQRMLQNQDDMSKSVFH